MTSLTQRAGGIVQRRRAKDGAEGGTNVSNDDKDLPIEDIDEDDRDSKETRLTLMEEILLLGLKDREVNIMCYNLKSIFFKFTSFYGVFACVTHSQFISLTCYVVFITLTHHRKSHACIVGYLQKKGI